jgi:hypothetical protein
MTQGRHSPAGGTWRRNAAIASVGLVVLGIGYTIVRIVSSDEPPRKRVMEVVKLTLVPPPPPPPPKEEPPPPPPKMLEQKIEPPVDKPDDTPKNEAPPPGPLALDAQGGPGSDAFGLGGKPGGSDYLIGGGGGGGGFGNRFSHYASLMQDRIGRRLHEDDFLESAKFRATIRVWITPVGRVERVQIMRTTGDGKIDTMPALPEAPPREMPQPVIVRIGATPGVG